MARAASRRTRRRGEVVSRRRRVARVVRRRIIIRSSCTPTRNPSREGRDARTCRLATVKRLLCDCSLVTVAEDDDGNPLDVGRKTRTVSTPLKRALYARDRGCTFPGCHRKRYLDGHHLRHWVDGGETSADNMTLLCTYHHRQLHEGGFSIVREEGGTLRFVTADGRIDPAARLSARGLRRRRCRRGGRRERPHVRDSAPGQCSTSGNDRRYAKPQRFIACTRPSDFKAGAEPRHSVETSNYTGG